MIDVSVVIPTIGRGSLRDAVRSALDQSHPVLEVIVSTDTASSLDLPRDDRVRVVGDRPGSGAQRARQVGVRSARGDVVALLDDDDLWNPYKIEGQLLAVSDVTGPWVASCRCVVRSADGSERLLPPRVARAHQDVAEFLYTYRFGRGGRGNGLLQSSTLMFPRGLASIVPLDADPSSVHHEASWLLLLREAVPDLAVVQAPDPWVIYSVAPGSLSRHAVDDSEAHLRWAEEYLGSTSARVRGDYGLTSPVSAAFGARSWRGLVDSVRHTLLTGGRPGMPAMLYCSAKAMVLLLRGRTTR
ncbi:glycosyltransferase [Rhodococcus sp. BP-349]|uniref:glycosyltransferase family 2 protein n=1 Tax=unclassified Rhodococcus (in: high G+C Gram-positive bacteria) TaxID=192944 RepID=UPI001C9ABE32|nr:MULTISPECIES: glycosyltransferase [unclassified Rhodococcus (in: high G+C Gram-positive bacteria)]MBY6539478.1 glycosyltransferase [Rhodococcus sp. BP-363]MBY6544194.1 glycosyltransferase [Rhodococcus sp. BP-369]MBY6563424.1 glycosyltransferase [Rhodococcus sp. BP-370]MBY6577716.1 glycosyltransferase [Rhodococcus sp. BP-364]MBY6587017.1 glycosyltransferase [Rhodococcus sp. BP-358]